MRASALVLWVAIAALLPGQVSARASIEGAWEVATWLRQGSPSCSAEPGQGRLIYVVTHRVVGGANAATELTTGS